MISVLQGMRAGTELRALRVSPLGFLLVGERAHAFLLVVLQKEKKAG